MFVYIPSVPCSFILVPNPFCHFILWIMKIDYIYIFLYTYFIYVYFYTSRMKGPFHLMYTPRPMDENFWGGGLKKPFLRGCVHRDPLIFAFFLRGKANISGGGVFCVGTLIFFLRGSNFIDLVHRGGGVYIKWNGPCLVPSRFIS